jgi:hypothetical protein
MIANAEQTTEAVAVEQPKATKKARAGAQSATVAPGKKKAGKKATPAKESAQRL